MTPQRWLPLTIATLLVACQGPTTAQGGTPPTQGQPRPAAGSPRVATPRVARRFPEVKAGQSFKVSQYWDFEDETPFEIEDAKAEAKAQSDGSLVTVWTADVKLPSAKLTAPKAKARKLLDEGSEEQPEEAQAEGEGGDEVQDQDEAKPTGASSPQPAGAEAIASPTAQTATGPLPKAGEEAEDEAEFSPEDFAKAPEDSEADEIEEEITPEADDVSWSPEEDYLTDADGDLEQDPEEAQPFQELWTEALEDKILAAPHPVKLTIKDLPMMAEGSDECVWEDTKTSTKLILKLSQDWGRFELGTGEGKALVFTRTPDQQFVVEGGAAGQSLADAILQDPQLAKVNGHLWAMFYARLSRMDLGEGQRGDGGKGLFDAVQGAHKQLTKAGLKAAAPVVKKVIIWQAERGRDARNAAELAKMKAEGTAEGRFEGPGNGEEEGRGT